jgi:hypothetical protein
MGLSPRSRRYVVLTIAVNLIFIAALMLPFFLIVSPWRAALPAWLFSYYLVTVFALYILFKVGRIVGAIFVGRADAADYKRTGIAPWSRNAVWQSDGPIEEVRVRAALDNLQAVHDTPPWVSEWVGELLSLPPGAERRQKRAELLAELYVMAGDSPGGYEVGRAYNQLRAAINPNVDLPD